MATYIYDYHDERGEFHAYVRDEAGNIIWEVHYPEYLEDDDTGELLEGSTIFEDGYLKNADDLEGLYYYLRDFGAIEEDDEVVKLEDYEKRQDAKDSLLDFAIPNWAMSAIVNGDTSGLEDEDIQKIDAFENRLVKLYGNANLMLGDIDGEDNLGLTMGNDIEENAMTECYRMYLRPTKSYEDGGALMDGQYGYGTSYLAKGGALEDKIKKKLGENFELPIEMAVYVPSTEKANQIISKRDFNSRVDEVRSYLSNLFGGYSSGEVEGGYVSQEKGLIQEDVTKVTAFSTKEDLEKKMKTLVTQISKWCGLWGQESIGFEFEGDLFYIDKNAKFMDGGNIPEGYHMMPDGTIMPDSAHLDGGGEVDDDEDEDKEQEHLEYVSEETNIPIDVLKEYANNKGIKIEELDTDLGYQGSFSDEEAFAQHCANEGLISNLSYYLEMYPTDKRILIGEMTDNYINDLSDEDILSQSSYEDDVEKLKEAEANLSIQEGELENLIDEKQDLVDSQDVESMRESDREEMDRALEEFDQKIEDVEATISSIKDDIRDIGDYDDIIERAREEVRDNYYDDLKDRLDKDAVGYFVDELGYDENDLVDKNGFYVDTSALARDLGHDYDFIEYEGDVYVFSSYYKYGGSIDLGSSFDKFKKTLNILPQEIQSQISDNDAINMAIQSVGDAWEDLTDYDRSLIVKSFKEGYNKGSYAKGGQFKVDPKYTHFAVGKRDGKIVTGWEYKDLDKESIKYYTKMDLVDMDFKPSDFRILTAKYLKAQGVDPFNWDNWRKNGDNYYAHGGSVEEGNLEMLKNQAKEFKHHAEELGEVLDKKPRVDAWVVAKAERATSDLSDITHYLDGQEDGESFEDGGVTPKVFEKVNITIRDVDMGGDVIYKNDHWINKKALDEKSSSDIGKYILNKYGLDYGNTYKFSLKRTGETREKDKKSVGGFIAGVAVGAIGSKLLSNDKKQTPKSKVEEKEMTWQEELKMYDDKEGFDYAINEYSSDIKDKKFIDLKNKYIRESNKIKKYIDSKEEIYDSKYDITVQDAIDKEGIDYALMGYNDWKGVKDKKFQDLLKEYLQSRKALSNYIGIGTKMAHGGEVLSDKELKSIMPNIDTSKKKLDEVSDDERQEVASRIDDLVDMVNKAKEKGEKPKYFNLCDISIPGTNIYCDDNLGIDRNDMPQFKGNARPNSLADQLPKDPKSNEVDTEEFFKLMLNKRGIDVNSGDDGDGIEVEPDVLKATQMNMVGDKVAGMYNALEKDPTIKALTAPIYVSNDGYVLDGHHRWAAIVTYNAKNPNNPIPMKVRVIDMPIEPLVELANDFADSIGIQKKAAVAGQMARGGKTKLEGWDKNNSIFAYAYAKDRQVKHDGTFEQFKKSYFNEVPEEGHYNDKVLRYAYDELNKKKGYARGGELRIDEFKDSKSLDVKYIPNKVYKYGVREISDRGFDLGSEEDFLYFKSIQEAKSYVKEKPYKREYLGIGMARGGELLSDVDMYVKIHGYYPMEVMAMRGDGMGTSIVRNEAHNFELSGVDSRKAEEMGYEFDYDQKGWVEVDEDDDDFAKGGSIDDLDEIKKGDYVNFGEYGNFYVVDTDYLIDGTHFWVTRDKENRTNSQAPGYTILKGDAQYIIEKYSNDDDFAKGGATKKEKADNSDLLRYANSGEQLKVLKDIIPVLNKKGIKLTYGTSIGKSPQTIIFDKDYQDNILYISGRGWQGENSYYGEDFNSADDLKYVIENPSDDDDYAKGGKLSSFFSKAKDYTKKQIKDKKRKIALEVIDSTKDKVSNNKQKMLLKSAEQIVEDKYARGGATFDDKKINEKLAIANKLISQGKVMKDIDEGIEVKYLPIKYNSKGSLEITIQTKENGSFKTYHKYQVSKSDEDYGEETRIEALNRIINELKSSKVELLEKGGKTKWIQEAIQKPGALRETAKRKGLIEGDEKLSKTDLKKLEKVGGKTGQRARLAATLKGLGKKKKMAKGGETKFINLSTRKGQSEVEKYTNQGWGIKFQNDKFAILERGGKKKN